MHAQHVHFKNTPNAHFLPCLRLEFAWNRRVEHCVCTLCCGKDLEHYVRNTVLAVCGSNTVLVVLWANIVSDTGIWDAVETKNMRHYGATFLDMTAILAPTARNWLDMFVSSAEKYRR